MDMREFRNSAVARFREGNADQLARQILENDLNKMEREFLAKFVRDNIPKGPRGPKRKSMKPVEAALIRFWRAEVEGWTDKDAIQYDIEKRLKVSGAMVRKYFRQVDNPQTKGQFEVSFFAEFEIKERRLALKWSDQEVIEIYREIDLKPISWE